MPISKISRRGILLRLLFLTAEAAVILITFKTVLLVGIVPSASMEPAVSEGSFILGTRSAFMGTLQRGDVAVFSGAGGQLYAKRIIGLPGEFVIIDAEGSVYIDGKQLDEPYAVHQLYGYIGSFNVPQDAYFVLGDNRPVSNDSRFWAEPFVGKEAIIAKRGIRFWFARAGGNN